MLPDTQMHKKEDDSLVCDRGSAWDLNWRGSLSPGFEKFLDGKSFDGIVELLAKLWCWLRCTLGTWVPNFPL